MNRIDSHLSGFSIKESRKKMREISASIDRVYSKAFQEEPRKKKVLSARSELLTERVARPKVFKDQEFV